MPIPMDNHLILVSGHLQILIPQLLKKDHLKRKISAQGATTSWFMFTFDTLDVTVTTDGERERES